MAFEVPFADSERMPPGMPPGDGRAARRGGPCRARLGLAAKVTAGLREDANRVVLAVHEEQVVEVDAGAVDVRRAAAVDVADGERIGRRDLVQVVEQRRVPVPRLVVERCHERSVDQFGEVALTHVGAVHVVVDAILAADDQAGVVRQGDDAAGGEVLVLVGIVAVDVAERREPVATSSANRGLRDSR